MQTFKISFRKVLKVVGIIILILILMYFVGQLQQDMPIGTK